MIVVSAAAMTSEIQPPAGTLTMFAARSTSSSPPTTAASAATCHSGRRRIRRAYSRYSASTSRIVAVTARP